MSSSSKSTSASTANADGTTTTAAGITYNANGQRIIPATQREDGTVRKERKVRPGYTPAEDVARYQNRTAEAFRTRGSGGVPGAGDVIEDDIAGADKGNSKNAKRRAARKKKAAAEGKPDGGDEEEVADESSASAIVTRETKKGDEVNEVQEVKTSGPQAREKEKQERNIRKKLGQARELQARREKGETLLPEQIAKAMKLQELVRELEKMGLDPSAGSSAS